MAKYNSGALYNAQVKDGGFFWNSDSDIYLISLSELFKVSESFDKLIVSMILKDAPQKVTDELVSTAFFKKEDSFSLHDESTVSILFELAEKLNIQDKITELLVLASLNDKVSVIDEVRQFVSFVQSEQINTDDIMDVETLLKTLDSFGLNELKTSVDILLSLYDRFGMTDRDPKTAVSDFIVGIADGFDNAYDWLIPFGLKVDWKTTSLQIMPETETTTVEIPGIDGSVVEDTVYKDRLFQIVGFSEDGLTREQKEELKARIADVLDATKNQTKKLTVQARGVSFDVKYDGQANITEGASYVKATIPFRTPPYAYESFENSLDGIGLVDNYGSAPLGVVHYIRGGISNPSFSLGQNNYTWNGTVPSGSTLVIDHDMLTCYLEDSFGNKTNALSKLNGKFYKIPSGQSVVLNANPQTISYLFTEWRIKVLW